MTSTQIASLLHGRRVGRGKYMAKCPAHRERTGSLSITDMGGGKTRLNCFAGCHQADVLKAAGLTWRDLQPDTEASPEIRRRYWEEKRLTQFDRQHAIAVLLASLEVSKRQYWEAAARRIADEMAPLYWSVLPDKDKLDRMFSLEWTRMMKMRADAMYKQKFIGPPREGQNYKFHFMNRKERKR